MKTELRAAEAGITTTLEVDPTLEFAVPVEMPDRYTYRNFEVTGVATYGRFRRFGVHTGEALT